MSAKSYVTHFDKFHDDDVIHKKIMTILSTGTSGISNVSYKNL